MKKLSKKMEKLVDEIEEKFDESRTLEDKIIENLKRLRYGF